ncbi:MAG: hypothetical protein GX128_03745 [Bacteroidales bacterium]|jgi:hypothetical protein|nr:hypothetical protein [Bacteroidales bacterium]NMA30401.1 hypothetical protein [Candidatus Methanofastidiosa archaeon]
MGTKSFEIKIYYTGFCTYEIEAQDKAEAIIKARNLPIIQNEVISNLENWGDADTAIEIKNEEDKI